VAGSTGGPIAADEAAGPGVAADTTAGLEAPGDVGDPDEVPDPVTNGERPTGVPTADDVD